ncbi:hypothetical protein LZM27_19000 [Pseudomonas aeruginosa]|uniref:hypothetical protein n=1 Tax=Pseudomonas aeruginosa TaxID=287 RepID=UPI001112D9B7|nr:hypothetical protein [Pseudomonas aeruginosa]EKZ3175687.1 hypothetical protein [Pseudomonas aeruginosa]MBA4913837.1 hypothetical protein [Pseudomonas aeruginosa]MBG4759235.1 hypothetical protein [Pseudomonas aeruginosa]MCT4805181.1 hypothetical protein [Pseudomonas aeruginosa]MCT4815312.1 hypothetical protein [Pseudomonas aeruginosa]
MDEWLTNPQFWVGAAVSGTVGWMPSIYRWMRMRAPSWFENTRGRIRRIYRAKRCKRLIRIKSIRFDSAKVNREIVLSYLLLGAFMTSTAACILSFVFAPPQVHKSYPLAIMYASLTGMPLLVFEFAWLAASTRVGDILKARNKIKRRGRRLI